VKIEDDNNDLERADDVSDDTEKDAKTTEPDYGEEDDEAEEQNNGGILFSNFQEKFIEIIENEEIEDAIELNEIFLSKHLNVKLEDLSRLSKIELRVDTSCHNL
jgi:hypothetical protein